MMPAIASVYVIDRDERAFCAGVELSNPINDKLHPIGIMSLYLPKSEYPSKKRCIIHIFAEVFKLLPDEADEVRFRSTSLYFRDYYKTLERKAGVFADGKRVSFHYLKRMPHYCVDLAEDAGKRRTSIVEIL